MGHANQKYLFYLSLLPIPVLKLIFISVNDSIFKQVPSLQHIPNHSYSNLHPKKKSVIIRQGRRRCSEKPKPKWNGRAKIGKRQMGTERERENEQERVCAHALLVYPFMCLWVIVSRHREQMCSRADETHVTIQAEVIEVFTLFLFKKLLFHYLISSLLFAVKKRESAVFCYFLKIFPFHFLSLHLSTLTFSEPFCLPNFEEYLSYSYR